MKNRFFGALHLLVLLAFPYISDAANTTRDYLLRFSQEVVDYKLDGEGELRVFEDKSSAVFSINIALRHAGAAYSDKEGMAKLLTMIYSEGPEGISVADFQKSLDSHGVSISYIVTPDDLLISLYGLPESIEFGLETISKVLLKPKLNRETFKKVKGKLLAALAYQNANDPVAKARDAELKMIFGKHPYANKADGTIDSIKNIKISDLAGYAKKITKQSAVAVTASGPISAKALKRSIERIVIKDLPSGALSDPVEIFPVDFVVGSSEVKQKTGRVVLGFSQKGYDIHDKHYAPYLVLVSMLGRPDLEALLMKKGRGAGLTYRINMEAVNYERAAFTYGFTVVDAAKCAKIADMIVEVLSGIAGSQAVKYDKLEDAKSYELSALAFSLASVKDRADFLMETVLHNMSMADVVLLYDAISDVSSSDVSSVAREVIDTKRLGFVTVD